MPGDASPGSSRSGPNEYRRRVIDHDAEPIAWREAGPPTGPLVVFLHGLGTTRTGWDPQLDALADRWRCVAWDMPGYGSSPSPSRPLDFGGIADAVAGLVRDLGARSAHLVGLSFGGMHALHTALRHPSVVRSLTLVDTSPAFGVDGRTTRDAWISARLAPLDQGMGVRDLAPAVMTSIAAPGFSGPGYEMAVASMGRISERGLRAAIHLLPDHDVRTRLGTITAPTLVVVGELDEETPPAYSAMLAEAIPDVRDHVVVAGAGHLTPLEAPESFNALLRSFLGSLPDPETP